MLGTLISLLAGRQTKGNQHIQLAGVVKVHACMQSPIQWLTLANQRISQSLCEDYVL